MRVLVGCEHSGRVRDAFIRRGHDAVSCDLLPTTVPGPHLQCDVLTVLNRGWDLAVFHPDCTYLCSSGLHWNTRTGEFGEFTEAALARRAKTEAALDFVRKLMAAPIEKIAIENPRGRIGSAIRRADQTIQPYEFGANASKATCFWLKNLTPLPIDPKKRFPGRWVRTSSGKLVERWANQTDSGQNNLGPSESRWAHRSLTYLPVAEAMAEHWGGRNRGHRTIYTPDIEAML